MAPTAPAPRHLGDPLLAGVFGGVAVAGLEIAHIAAHPSLAITLLALFSIAGLVAGALMALTIGWTDWRGWHGWGGALVKALPVLLVLVPVGRTLFEGAYASTLPGAAAAPYLVPLIGLAMVTIAVRVGTIWFGNGSTPRRLSLLAALLVALIVSMWINRTVYRFSYLDAHAALTIASIVLAAVAFRVAIGLGPFGSAGRLGLAVVAVSVAMPMVACGLGSADDRRRVATAADEGRHLIRIARAIFDADGDGHAALLGGGDCDDRDAERNPAARDQPGNGRDEDCDGIDAAAPTPAPAPPSHFASEYSQRLDALRARTRDMNVVLVSVDALRADLFDRGAPGRIDFPHLTGFFDHAVWFTRAFAPSAGTDISLGTVLTGRINPFQRLRETLLEALRASGRRTHAILPREVLRYAGETLLTRGLDSYDPVVTDSAGHDVGDRITAATSTDRALGFLDRAGGQPFALWVHYFDVHEHAQIDVPDELLAGVRDRGTGARSHRYRALARNVDAEIGRLFGEIAARGLADRTIVVFFSDHGESLGEDPRLPDNHGLVVYNALTRVPLAVRIPGVAPSEDLEPVSLVDVAPTVLALLSEERRLESTDGVSLAPHLVGAPVLPRDYDRVLVMNEQDQWGVIDWPWKLLVRPADNLIELYHIDRDPAEHVDLAAAEPERVRTLRARYGALPVVSLDRTRAGRQWRERQARPPRPR